MELTVSLAQMAVVAGEPAVNEATARRLAAQAAAEGADLLLLPELWSSGYELARATEYAAPLDRGPFAVMADLARMHHLYVAGTALEANPAGRPFNSAVIYAPQGALAARLQVADVPTVFVIGRDGRIAHVLSGSDSSDHSAIAEHVRVAVASR